MAQITTFDQAQNALRPLYHNARTSYTLDTMQVLMQYLGNPQNSLKVLHVAGTSGKTSTAYYASALLAQAGKQVGLSVSPHVDNLNERLQINGTPVPEAEFCRILETFLQLIADCPVQPSYFECLVAMAYWDFARRGLDYAVIEVGLGGLLDGTNVVTRADKVCLIADIGLDHTEILGDTLPKIAFQKAGIIHPGNQVFMYEQTAEIRQIVQKVADEKNANLRLLTVDDGVALDYLPLFQQRNLGLAVAAVKYSLHRDSDQELSQDHIIGAACITVPARLERFDYQGKIILLDGSHNQQKLQAMVQGLEQLYAGKAVAVVAGFVAGNDQRWQSGLAELFPIAEHIIFTSFYSEKDYPKTSVPTAELMAYCAAHDFTAAHIMSDPAQAFAELLERPEPVLLVTGSFYLMNHIRPLLEELS